MKKSGKRLLLWTPGIETHGGRPSANLGDLIIEEAVEAELRTLFPQWEMQKVSTHLRFGPAHRRQAREADLIVVGGSNLLSSYMDGYFQWDLTMVNAVAARGSVLMGAGWWRDQGVANRYTKILLNLVLSRKFKHSVRDGQAAARLREIHIPKVLNTACPTMWKLAEMDLSRLRTKPAEKVLCMLTDYYPEPELDRRLLDLLKERYKTVYFWPQGLGDEIYSRELSFDGVLLDRNLEALDELLATETELDYVGTRLHGGVRCLKAGKRCLTLEVDNRAREIGKDTGLPTAARSDLEAVRKWTEGSDPVQLRLPRESIQEWKGQFARFSEHE
ncbi:MAG: polysaccharide pyruvyl transferase family protein [Verrucomicrobia bacterium]|jgi:polysaccharide pyruvyl transferase WcaK-like protein|nr:polysaccharide pyruvyl transferase family protein [Verrucomicrobiota bacterium]